ncbi:MAG: VanW family protein [Lachnospiraceae bacterium]|nr:VanW family protein [Lachnospiraceae bacterium]
MKKKFKGILVCLMVTTLVLSGIMPTQVQASDKVDYSAVFNADYYFNAYADLRSAIGYDREKLLQHFITFGMQEGRRGNAEFDVKAYMGNYPDLMQAFGPNDLKSYYFHYISYGKKEGRNAASTNTNISIAAPAQSLISSYTTAFDASQSRAVNIALAASKINGTLIKPGQKFSFSDTVGPRTAENGFIEAPSFSNGKVISDIGGGICQVSSTTYAAMLQGGIKATQRYAHSMPVSYIPEGMDATIVAGQKDLTFTNNFAFPIVINASVNGGTLTVSFSKR